jgi:hypothetical protein
LTDEIVGSFVRSPAGVVDWCFVGVDPLQSTYEIVRFRREKLNRDRGPCRGTFKEVEAGCGTRPQAPDHTQTDRNQAGVVERSFVGLDTLQSTDEMVRHFVRSPAGVIEWCFVDIDTLQSTDEMMRQFVQSPARIIGWCFVDVLGPVWPLISQDPMER